MATTFHRCDPTKIGLATDLVRRVHTLEGATIDRRALHATLDRFLNGERHAHLWIIEQDGSAAGYLVVQLHPRNGYVWREASITALYVRPEFRGKGIGSKARLLARDEAPRLGGCLRWRQTYPEDLAIVPVQTSAENSSTTMVAA